MELYPNVKVKVLKWGEDLWLLPNKLCPICGEYFELDQRIVEVGTEPVFKVTGDPEADSFIVAFHYKCVAKIYKEIVPEDDP